MKIRPILGYSAAALTIAVAIFVPALHLFFADKVNALGLHVDDMYGGGPVVRTIDKGAYKIDVHKQYEPKFLQRAEPYVQLSWLPPASLPAQINDDVDLDGDGKPDMHVSFITPKSADSKTTVTVIPLSPRFAAVQIDGQESFTRMIMPLKDKVIVRIPLKR